MKRIFGFLKSYWLYVALAALLLFVQANMDLALPDYMSKIINTGIQQSGIERVLPEVISRENFGKLLFLADKDKASLILSSYAPLGKEYAGYEPLAKRFPGVSKTETMYLTDKGRENQAALSNALRPGLAAAGYMLQLQENPEMAKKMLEKLPEQERRNFGTVPENPDDFKVMKDKLNEFLPKEEFMQKQAAITVIRHEYEKLGADIGAMQNRYVLRTGLKMVLFTLISVIATIMVSLLAARTSAGVSQKVRSAVFTRVESYSAAEFDKFSTASLITRCTNDITQIQMLVFMMMRMVMYAPIMGVGGVIRALGKAPSMAWLIGLAVLVLLVTVGIVASVAMPRFRLIQKLVDKLNKVARENLSGIMVVRAFNRQRFEEERFDNANKDLTSINLFIIRLMAGLMPVIMLIMNLLSVAVIWVGAKEIAASQLLVGDMMAFLQYAMQIVMSFMMLTMLFIILPRAIVSAGRIAEVLDTDSSIIDPANPAQLPETVRGLVEFKDVSFSYPGAIESAVSNISFTAEPGKTTAIIGSTGSGKSTLVNLIPRFYDVSSGQILLDGTDIRELRQHDLRSRIAYVPQTSVLFSGTIKSNLAYADENADDQVLTDAAGTAQAAEFIKSRPEGINAETAQGGTNFSGGQKQRLSIARALVKKSPVMIFDDSFSALDFRTDAALRAALKKDTGESTLIIIAQRVSTIMKADQILVLDEGKIVGRGTHDELMKDCTAYREIAVSQLDLEETA